MEQICCVDLRARIIDSSLKSYLGTATAGYEAVLCSLSASGSIVTVRSSRTDCLAVIRLRIQENGEKYFKLFDEGPQSPTVER